jgi:hypothetical protein
MIKREPARISLSTEQVDEICNEIEHQWLYLLMVRAVFNNIHFPKDSSYTSPGFYTQRGIGFRISIPYRTEVFNKAALGLKNWLNQNYVIRLYGILEKHHILYFGRKVYRDPLMILLYELRPKIGAHSSGRKPSDKKHLRKATRIINELFMTTVKLKLDEVEHYALPIDHVLEPMKKKAIEFVRSLKS